MGDPITKEIQRPIIGWPAVMFQHLPDLDKHVYHITFTLRFFVQKGKYNSSSAMASLVIRSPALEPIFRLLFTEIL